MLFTFSVRLPITLWSNWKKKTNSANVLDLGFVISSRSIKFEFKLYNSISLSEFKKVFFRESKFRETGVINPDEFVAAGDHLVHHCPSWQWAVGDPTNIKVFSYSVLLSVD